MTPYVAAWGEAFAITLVVELGVAGPWLARRSGERGKAFAAVVFAQIASHPAVWFIFPALGLDRMASLTLSEAWAVVLEAIMYAVFLRKVDPLLACAVSLVANGASFSVGLLMRSMGLLH